MDTTDTVQHGQFAGARLPALPKVRLVFSPGTGLVPARAYPLTVGATPIGRELPNADGIEIQDRRISRVHAVLRVTDDLKLSVTDNGSKNGTFVNRRPVGAAAQPLKDGDVLRVGDAFLVVRYAPLYPADSEIPTLLGVAPSMMALRSEIRRVAVDAAPVLLLGETGTGKELLARSLHDCSSRRGDFIAVNCAAIPQELAESQLFGHVAGAFTGAKAYAGFFRAAQGGTLFLDEIGELPLPLQAKLLRVLQEHEVTPVGAVKPVPCDARVVAATHRDLSAAVARDRFRQDLYSRLDGVQLHLPPLRERREDILLLLGQALAGSRPDLAPDLIEALLLYAWPRNVREVIQTAHKLRLRNADQELFNQLSQPVAQPVAPPAASPPDPPSAAEDKEAKDAEDTEDTEDTEAAEDAAPASRGRPPEVPMPSEERLREVMTAHRGNIRQIAGILGCSRRQVGRMLEHYALDRNSFRGKAPKP